MASHSPRPRRRALYRIAAGLASVLGFFALQTLITLIERT